MPERGSIIRTGVFQYSSYASFEYMSRFEKYKEKLDPELYELMQVSLSALRTLVLLS